MFCSNCGSQLEDGVKFCSNCGEKVMSEDEIDQIVATENKKKQEKYLKLENIERFAPMATLLPLVILLLGIIFSILGRILSLIGWHIRVFWMISQGIVYLQKFVNILLLVAALAAFGGLVYIAAKFKDREKVVAWVAPIAAFLAVLSCMGVVFQWKAVALICGIAATVFGIEFLARIVIAKKPIDSAMDFGAAAATYQQYFNDYKEKHPKQPKPQKAEYTAPVSPMNAQQPVNMQQPMNAQQPVNMQQPISMMQPASGVSGDSYFDGSGLELLGYSILTIIVGTITCGIATPWMLCKIYSWKAQHTVINGKRLTFIGNGASLLGHWILWEILTVITCGIYSFFAHAALRRWELSNTYIVGEQVMINEKASYFDGGSLAYFGYNLLSALLLTVTCGLSFPWVMAMMQNWETKHEVINYRRLAFSGTGLGFLGEFLIILLLSVVTCGIYLPWGTVRLLRYVIKHTDFVN